MEPKYSISSNEECIFELVPCQSTVSQYLAIFPSPAGRQRRRTSSHPSSHPLSFLHNSSCIENPNLSLSICTWLCHWLLRCYILASSIFFLMLSQTSLRPFWHHQPPPPWEKTPHSSRTMFQNLFTRLCSHNLTGWSLPFLFFPSKTKFRMHGTYRKKYRVRDVLHMVGYCWPPLIFVLFTAVWCPWEAAISANGKLC